mmetsp:Transcript_12930/g.15119  ORF Transcript_12930/g.15119 Transcript_12930/m.15119 type:complete len:150 (+) Transcript_12930:118-567(+)
MVRFTKAAARPPATSNPPVPITDLAALMAMNPPPLQAVSTMGRVTFQFGYTPGRYPGLKFVICGKSPESEAGDVAHVMVKANTRPSVVPDVDALVVLQHVQVRECWRNTSGVIPESLVIHGLAVRELALTLPGPKRGRDAIQSSMQPGL